MNGLNTACVTPVTRRLLGNAPRSNSMRYARRPARACNQRIAMQDTGSEVRQLLGLSRRPSPEERLAGAVILRAVQDCTRLYLDPNPAGPTRSGGRGHRPILSSGNAKRTDEGEKIRPRYVYRDDGRAQGIQADTARSFLSQQSLMLSFWCSLLQIRPELIIDVYTRTIRRTSP